MNKPVKKVGEATALNQLALWLHKHCKEGTTVRVTHSLNAFIVTKESESERQERIVRESEGENEYVGPTGK